MTDENRTDDSGGEPVADNGDGTNVADTSGGERPSEPATAEAVYEHLEPFEPYTTDELAETLAVDRGRLRTLLDRLVGEGKVRKKNPPRSPTIWVREPPAHACPECGREFEIKFLHPVLSAVQFCPRCGTQL